MQRYVDSSTVEGGESSPDGVDLLTRGGWSSCECRSDDDTDAGLDGPLFESVDTFDSRRGFGGRSCADSKDD